MHAERVPIKSIDAHFFLCSPLKFCQAFTVWLFPTDLGAAETDWFGGVDCGVIDGAVIDGFVVNELFLPGVAESLLLLTMELLPSLAAGLFP